MCFNKYKIEIWNSDTVKSFVQSEQRNRKHGTNMERQGEDYEKIVISILLGILVMCGITKRVISSCRKTENTYKSLSVLAI